MLITLPPAPAAVVVDYNVSVPMRDGVQLRADVYRPSAEGRFPVLVYRTPYGKHEVPRVYTTVSRAVARGYAVVVQDVRGRYASAGTFDPYRQEGRDGYDTIEWAAVQPWSNGAIGSFGLSYPAAVQWLAAVESPPHLRAMVPAMTFATPSQFFYSGGAWDLSWAYWTAVNILPDLRVRANRDGPRTEDEARRAWARDEARILGQRPLLALTDFAGLAPWYTEWMRHAPDDPWWDWAELRGRYGRTSAAVLNWSGWHDEAYGPSGAITNFLGVWASRGAPTDAREARIALILGPWVHGVDATRRTRAGDRAFAPNAAVDYDGIVLDWMDRHVKDDSLAMTGAPVRVYLMGANQWIEAPRWPIPGIQADTLYLRSDRRLAAAPPADRDAPSSAFTSDPANPVRDPYHAAYGAHDLRALTARADVLVFETAPLASDVDVVGALHAELFVSTALRDVDLYVKVLDVAPDGTAFNLMSPGLEVQRASAVLGRTEPSRAPEDVFRLTWSELLTANRFRAGHRLRVMVMGAYQPHFSLNLQTGASERDSSRTLAGRITVWHDPTHRSRVVLPVLPLRAPR